MTGGLLGRRCDAVRFCQMRHHRDLMRSREPLCTGIWARRGAWHPMTVIPMNEGVTDVAQRIGILIIHEIEVIVGMSWRIKSDHFGGWIS